jgi:hypothetical protein
LANPVRNASTSVNATQMINVHFIVCAPTNTHVFKLTCAHACNTLYNL